MKKRLASIALVALLVFACAGAPPTPEGPDMIPGHMFNLKDGTEFEFAIERSSGIGIMTARNMRTGEEFTGNYTAMVVDGGVSTETYTNSWGFSGGTVTRNTPATKAVGKGILKGNAGTVISISMDIKPSYNINIYPSGFGEGTDNHGVKYQVQFGGG